MTEQELLDHTREWLTGKGVETRRVISVDADGLPVSVIKSWPRDIALADVRAEAEATIAVEGPDGFGYMLTVGDEDAVSLWAHLKGK